MDDLEPLADAEQRLLEAVQTSGPCDLSQDDDTHRRVRAAFLKAILSGEGKVWRIGAGAPINLHGAVVSGDLGGLGGMRLPPIRLESCRFENSVDFSGATFTGAAVFNGTTFRGVARFVRATFTRDAGFVKAIFTRATSFDEATFTGDASFDGALAHRLSFKRALFSAPTLGRGSHLGFHLSERSWLSAAASPLPLPRLTRPGCKPGRVLTLYFAAHWSTSRIPNSCAAALSQAPLPQSRFQPALRS